MTQQLSSISAAGAVSSHSGLYRQGNMSSLDSDYVLLQSIPSPQLYHDLRKAANLTPPSAEALRVAVPQALDSSFAGFLAYERKDMVDETTPGDQPAVAMGRLVGDGQLFLQLVDLAVHPDHQGRGVGKALMEALVDYVDKHSPHVYLSLVAEPAGQNLYPRFGFEDVRPSVGMYRCHWIQQNPELRQQRAAKGRAMLR